MVPFQGYYTPEQARRIKDVERATIYSAIHGGRLVAEIVGGRRMISAAALEAWHPLKDPKERGKRGAAATHGKHHHPTTPAGEGDEG